MKKIIIFLTVATFLSVSVFAQSSGNKNVVSKEDIDLAMISLSNIKSYALKYGLPALPILGGGVLLLNANKFGAETLQKNREEILKKFKILFNIEEDKNLKLFSFKPQQGIETQYAFLSNLKDLGTKTTDGKKSVTGLAVEEVKYQYNGTSYTLKGLNILRNNPSELIFKNTPEIYDATGNVVAKEIAGQISNVFINDLNSVVTNFSKMFSFTFENADIGEALFYKLKGLNPPDLGNNKINSGAIVDEIKYTFVEYDENQKPSSAVYTFKKNYFLNNVETGLRFVYRPEIYDKAGNIVNDEQANTLMASFIKDLRGTIKEFPKWYNSSSAVFGYVAGGIMVVAGAIWEMYEAGVFSSDNRPKQALIDNNNLNVILSMNPKTDFYMMRAILKQDPSLVKSILFYDLVIEKVLIPEIEKL